MDNWKKLPMHVSVFISTEDVNKFVTHLNSLDFREPPIQVYKRHVLFSKIIDVTFEGIEAELHIRIFDNGKIEAEYEPPRLKKWLDHIICRSYSAHEFVISTIERIGITYKVDEEIRSRYNHLHPKEFRVMVSELISWFFNGLLLSTPSFLYHKIRDIIKQKSSNSIAG